VISGSVLRSGDQVRVTAQLIEAETDQYLWAESFDRELRDILALYSDVARAVAGEVEVAMTPGEETRLAGTRPVDPKAYELYVQGRYHFNRRQDGLKQANELFQQAVETDPSFPQAHAALAYSYVLMNNTYGMPAREAFPKAKSAALKAQEMDDTLAETEKALISVRWSYEKDWLGVKRGLARALEISPGDPVLHSWYAQRLSMIGRHDEAIAEIRKACELDPYAMVHRSRLGRILYFARRYDEAAEHLRLMVGQNPDRAGLHLVLSHVLLKKGMPTEAIEAAETGVELIGNPNRWGWLAYVYAAAERRDEARRILGLEQEHMSAGFVATVHTALGEKDLAFAWLDKAYEAYDSSLHVELHDPIWDPLRDDPRFEDLLRRLNNPYRAPAGESSPQKEATL
jgi:tetratricopeptide (TPR) repeat protein